MYYISGITQETEGKCLTHSFPQRQEPPLLQPGPLRQRQDYDRQAHR